MEQYVFYIFWLVVLIMVCSLGFSIVSLCYTWIKLKMTEIQERIDL